MDDDPGRLRECQTFQRPRSVGSVDMPSAGSEGEDKPEDRDHRTALHRRSFSRGNRTPSPPRNERAAPASSKTADFLGQRGRARPLLPKIEQWYVEAEQAEPGSDTGARVNGVLWRRSRITHDRERRPCQRQWTELSETPSPVSKRNVTASSGRSPPSDRRSCPMAPVVRAVQGVRRRGAVAVGAG